MEGDVCLLEVFLNVTKSIFPAGNCQFIVDEAHSMGIIGPKGARLVSHIGLEKEIKISLHTFGKAVGSAGDMHDHSHFGL
jgi:8-amino-7-oxononanoate synthase